MSGLAPPGFSVVRHEILPPLRELGLVLPEQELEELLA